jgi:hypothetical protein
MMNKIIQVTKKAVINNRPSLRRVMESLSPIPGHAVVFGISNGDGLPVYLNAQDTSAPNIVVWDKLARQSVQILKVIAEYLFQYHAKVGFNAKGIEFVVLTLYPEDWGELNKYGMGMMGKTSCIGIIPFYSDLAEKVIEGLAKWVHERHNSSKQPVIILVDGLENIEKMSESFKNHFRYLLDLGRTKNVYIIGTSSKNKFAVIQKWLDGFQREIYGMDVSDEFEYVLGKDTLIFYTPRTELL